MSTCIGPIPAHLSQYEWYAPHQAWLRDNGYPHHAPGTTSPRRATLRKVDLGWADLREAAMGWADLCKANLRGADLRGAIGLPEAPVVPNIDAAILAAIRTQGCSLKMNRWHSCETTHCRAGWAIHLAGEAGYTLERATTPYLAGRLIYEASRPGVPCPDFFASDLEALADLAQCATAFGASC